ncbi:hypothetical protein INT45_011324 [Circinella minor]|uniref:Uncharacterized protein n=1 Tax=Circinella minor TaxID=1195481 RepID=A0A8H7VJT0_9FUNG|nr:hypothetical protein INT45_011324 [Circinella minor]
MNIIQTSFHNSGHIQWSAIIRRTFTISTIQYNKKTTTDNVITSVARTRRIWTDEESDRLINLVETMGPKWTQISRTLDRPPSVVYNRYKHLTDTTEFHGPWTEVELNSLREATKGQTDVDRIDWNKVRLQLPRLRPISIIRLTYKHSVDPKIRHGRWSEKEVERLQWLVKLYGTDNWDAVADALGTRTKRQTLERWRWQQAGGLKKGRFTKEEDDAIIRAVEEHGVNFAKVKKAIGSERTARNISQHYRYALCPSTDRSPWSEEEENRMYDLCTKYKHDMNKVKAIMKGNRSPKDMWNHYYKVQKQRRDIEKQGKQEQEKSSTTTTTTIKSESKPTEKK